MFLSLEASARRWAALLLTLSLLACKSEIEPVMLEPDVVKVPDPEAPKVTSPSVPSLFLELRALKGGPVAEATVQTASGKSERTNAAGQLLLEKLQPGLQLLHVQAPGFSPSLAAFHLTEGVRAGATLELIPLGEPIPFEASQGITFTQRSTGLQLSIPPGALHDEKGNPIQGQVEVFMAMLDLEGAGLLAAPGLMEGVVNGAQVSLESLGVVVIIFRQDGQVIPFAKRISFRGRGPRSVRAGSHKPLPEMVPAWRLEPGSGQWSPTGSMGRIEIDPEQPDVYSWEVTVDNPSPVLQMALPNWWRSEKANSANPLQPPEPAWVETACLKVRVDDEKGQPVAGRTVVARGIGYSGMSRGVTDGGGQVLLAVTRDQEVRLDAGGALKEVRVSSNAGTCSEQGAAPQVVTLRVPARTCTPGDARDCAYRGSEETRDVGACHAARQYCDVTGTSWGVDCHDEVLPQEERCDTEQDDDCDGTANEECPSCEPGTTRTCYEGKGTEGVGICRGGTQTCLAGGKAWSACEGQVLPEAVEDCSRPGDENCDGVACDCWPGESRRCDYNGPRGTEDVGPCRASTQTCIDSGTGWSTCSGEVTPQAESCANVVDDDCNGQVNDAPQCVCLPGTSESRYTGPAGTEGVGLCKAGVRHCDASGTGWGAYEGEVLPLPQEDCNTAGDDDCDGVANESTVCVCATGETRSCYSGPAGTEGVGLCRAGTQTCNASRTGWDACSGEVTPQPESCARALDEDCDGQRNEAPPCGWVVTTGMNSARVNHAAVVLLGGSSNGHVLAMGGGSTGGAVLDTAEVYDPAAKTWTPVGTMTAKRKNFSAVRLSNGTVLAMGGQGDPGILASAELYDPAARTWSSDGVGSMASAREWHTATLLDDGKVLVTGGFDSAGNALNSAELYDPVAKIWSSAGNMSTARVDHTATLLSNGKVLVTGGRMGGRDDYTRLSSAELYDPVAKTWTPVKPMNEGPRSVHTATRLNDGTVLVAGGYGISGHVMDAEVYDSSTDTWLAAGTLNRYRDEHTAVLLPTGHVLISGGDDTVNSTDTAEMYDPEARTWTTVAPMSAARSAHTMVLLDSGEVFVMGGRSTSNGPPLVTTEVYNPAPQTQARSWMSTRSMATQRYAHTATWLGNGKVLVTGGRADTGVLSSAEVYDLATGTWSSTGAMNSPREKHTATLLPGGKVLVVGGRNGTVLDTAEVYDPDSGEWAYTTAALGPTREQHTATLLPDGKVLVAGGYDGSYALDSSMLYDPDSGTWSHVGNLSQARRWHTATLLPDGKVLVTGGHDGSQSIGTAELYTPSGTWTLYTALALNPARDWHTATQLDDGKVLITGGHNDGGEGFLKKSELYASGDTGWSATGELTRARREHTATLLPDGKVLVVGGKGTNGSGDIYLPSTELYDPAAGTWSSANLLATPIARHTATLLDNGMVLITGGHNDSGSQNSVLLYSP